MHPCLSNFGVVTYALQFREAAYNLAVGQGAWQGAGESLCHVAARLTGAKVAERADSTEEG